MILKNQLQINTEEIIPELVGKPFNDPFEIYIFNIKEKNIKIQPYDTQIIEKFFLNEFNNIFSAYCNGNNKLYMSGGEKNNSEIINKLWIIDLFNKQIQETPLLSPKKYHSMIFIPDNYVFFIGGNDENTFYYDIKKSTFYDWSELNKKRIQPSLIRVSNYLYCFDSIKDENNDFTLEKTDLNNNDSEWILLKPKLDLSFQFPKFFGVANYSNDEIIFLGGNFDDNIGKNNLVNYLYHINKNEIETSDVPYINYSLKEKTFIKYNKNIFYILPDFNRNNPEVIFYTKNKNITKKIILKPNKNIKISSISNYSLGNVNDDIEKTNFIFPDSFQDSILLDNSQIKINNENTNINNIKDLSKKHNGNDSMNHSINKNLDYTNNNRFSDKNKTSKNKRPYSYRNPFFGRINDYNNEIIIPKFHFHVNAPGEELRILKKNKAYNNYQPIEYPREKINQGEINKNGFIFLPNYNHNYGNNYNFDIDTKPIIQEQNTNPIKLNSNQIESKNEIFSIDGIIDGVNKSKNEKDKTILNNNNFNKNDFLFTGVIEGVKNKSDIKSNPPKSNLNINLIKKEENNFDEIEIPEIEENENKPKIEVSSHGNFIPDIQKFNILQNIDKKSLTNKDNNSIKDNGENNVEIKNNIPIIEVAPIEINDLNHNKNKLEINLKPNVVEESKKDINTLPENNTNNNRIDIPKNEHSDENVSEIKFKSPQVTIDKNKEKNENNKNNIEANKGKKDINLKETEKNKKEFLLEGMITGIKSPLKKYLINFNISDEMLKENKKKANLLRNSSSEVKGPRIIKKNYNAYNSSINNKLNSKKNLIKNPNFKFEGSIPGTKIDYLKGKTNSNFHNNSITNNFKLEGIIKGKKPNDLKKMNSIDTKNSKNKNNNPPEIKININEPSLNIKKDINSNLKSPNNNMSPSEINMKSPGKSTNGSFYGIIEGKKLNSPKKVNYNYILEGKIPGVKNKSVSKSNKKTIPNFLLEGIIPSNKNYNPKPEIKPDYKINSPKKNILENNNKDNNDINNIIINSPRSSNKQNNIIINDVLNNSKKQLNFSNKDDKTSKKSDKISNNNIKVINGKNNNNILDVKPDIKSDKSNVDLWSSKIENENNINSHFGSIVISDDKNLKNFSKRSSSKKKKKGLPLVGSKTNLFEVSKKGVVGDLNVDDIQFKNLKNSNVGINGAKIADRIIE